MTKEEKEKQELEAKRRSLYARLHKVKEGSELSEQLMDELEELNARFDELCPRLISQEKAAEMLQEFAESITTAILSSGREVSPAEVVGWATELTTLTLEAQNEIKEIV